MESDLYSNWTITLLEFTSILIYLFDPISESLIDCFRQSGLKSSGIERCKILALDVVQI